MANKSPAGKTYEALLGVFVSILPNTAPPSIIARENTKKNLGHAPSKLLDRPLGMPVHLTYSTSVGDTKLSNVYAKIYNNEKENLITDYSSLFKKENVDSLFSQIPTQAKIGKELGVSLIDTDNSDYTANRDETKSIISLALAF